MSKKLYIGNLPTTANDESLTKDFAAHGEVKSAVVVTDKKTGASKGYAFVEMADEQAAEKAIAALNDTEGADDKKLIVAAAKPEKVPGKPGKRRGPGGHPGVKGGRGNRW